VPDVSATVAAAAAASGFSDGDSDGDSDSDSGGDSLPGQRRAPGTSFMVASGSFRTERVVDGISGVKG